jgi:hypothetical protein
MKTKVTPKLRKLYRRQAREHGLCACEGGADFRAVTDRRQVAQDPLPMRACGACGRGRQVVYLILTEEWRPQDVPAEWTFLPAVIAAGEKPQPTPGSHVVYRRS